MDYSRQWKKIEKESFPILQQSNSCGISHVVWCCWVIYLLQDIFVITNGPGITATRDRAGQCFLERWNLHCSYWNREQETSADRLIIVYTEWYARKTHVISNIHRGASFVATTEIYYIRRNRIHNPPDRVYMHWLKHMFFFFYLGKWQKVRQLLALVDDVAILLHFYW